MADSFPGRHRYVPGVVRDLREPVEGDFKIQVGNSCDAFGWARGEEDVGLVDGEAGIGVDVREGFVAPVPYGTSGWLLVLMWFIEILLTSATITTGRDLLLRAMIGNKSEKKGASQLTASDRSGKARGACHSYPAQHL